MKILLVQESDWIERNPHQQHHLMEILSAKGHEIIVIDYGIDWRRKDKKWHGIYVKRQIFNDYYKINPESKVQIIRPSIIEIPIIDYLSIPYFHGKEINRQITEFKPDVIIAFGLLNAYYASKAAKKNSIPFVYYLIDVLYALIPEKPIQPLGKYLKKRTIRNSTKIITINKRLAELAIELGAEKEKISVIDAGIYLDEFDPEIDGSKIRKEYGIRKDETVLFYMGWIYHFAGIKEIARDLIKIKGKNPKIKLMVVGDGDAYEDLQKIKEEYNLDNQLILTGKQPYEKIPEYIAASDICLLPAYPDEEIMQDIVPIKLYEYMAMKKPVITTKLPGIMMEFGNGNGLIYVNEPEDVLNKVMQLINDHETNDIGEKARKYVEDNDWNKISSKFEKTLEDLI